MAVVSFRKVRYKVRLLRYSFNELFVSLICLMTANHCKSMHNSRNQ